MMLSMFGSWPPSSDCDDKHGICICFRSAAYLSRCHCGPAAVIRDYLTCSAMTVAEDDYFRKRYAAEWATFRVLEIEIAADVSVQSGGWNVGKICCGAEIGS